MNADFLRYRGLLAAAVGAGVVLGAAGIFLYHQLYAERRRMLLQRDLERLGMTVAEIKEQLEEFRKHKRKCANGSRFRGSAKNNPHNSVVDAGADSDMDMSVYWSQEEDDDEFFDFSSDNEELIGYNAEPTENKEVDPVLNDLFTKVDKLFTGSSHDKTVAYDMLIETECEHPNSVEVLWRLAKASHMMGSICGVEGDADKKKEYILEGLEFAKKAVEIDDNHSEAHKWFAVTVGSRGEFLGNKEKIEDGYVFKQHVDRALELRPKDPSLHHLLGRFEYEVAMLSWIERKLAATFFAEPPNGDFAKAMECFLQAEKLSPKPWKENRLFLAKSYIQMSNYSKAIEWLDKAAAIPVESAEDKQAEEEVQNLRSKYESYRL